MNSEMLMKFKTLFENEKTHLTYTKGVLSEDFQISKDDMLDETDQTSTELETSMRMRLRSREALYLKKIDEALRRISEGSFGECTSCGDEIELRRLEARPTATLCLSCKEEEERKEYLHIDGHKSKSLGHRARFAV